MGEERLMMSCCSGSGVGEESFERDGFSVIWESLIQSFVGEFYSRTLMPFNRDYHFVFDHVKDYGSWSKLNMRLTLMLNSEAKKYKTAHLQHRDLLEKLFDGLSATGDFAWSSGMGSAPFTQ
ncbi:hypothetical protein GIB67_021368 [Kingdonia uniflora]|uniref:Uncharacterized protein n=1 Tax=Kingdonia uniflora TaxID=39325 RepID=A0A7J7MD79_9MAGN|nr:hypothetical protein GIB67_021368 [Kingdonia uniflora]